MNPTPTPLMSHVATDCPDCKGENRFCVICGPTPTPNSPAPVDIARLRELLAKATPGHWFEHWFRSHIPVSKSDADFIATIRNEAPALLDEVERLRYWKESMLRVEAEADLHSVAEMLGAALGKSVRKEIAEKVPKLIAECDSLRQENARLIAEIEGLKANQKESQ